jgi:hypothetical protein
MGRVRYTINSITKELRNIEEKKMNQGISTKTLTKFKRLISSH